jgi:hypothetical protein
LWGRQMTLGPTLEFCLHSRGPIPVPETMAPFAIRCRTVWAG